MSRLFVVEDDAVLRSALSHSLKLAGYEVESAENGLEALEKVSGKAFDLIISDIRMPGLDGVATLSKIKETSPFIKSILITGYSDEEPMVRALNLGVDGILKKPFNMKDLFHMVSVKLEEKEKEDLLRKQEGKYRALLSKMSEKLDQSTFNSLAGEDFPLAFPVDHQDSDRIATLLELGRMTQMRQEHDAALQAYEGALELLSGGGRQREEFQVRLALSTLFEKRGETDLAVFHAGEALNLALRLKEVLLLIDAHQNFGKVLINLNPEQSLSHLKKARALLQGQDFKERQASSALILSSLALKTGKKEEAKFALAEFLSFGKRHFLPQLLLSLKEIAFFPFLLGFEEGINPENACWVLEETAPFLQDKLQEALKVKPALSEILSQFLKGEKNGNRHTLQVFGFGKLAMFLEGKPIHENHWKSLKGLSIFLYLLHQYPKVISEEHLLDIFWPSLDLEKGRHTFRTTLYFIRRTLGNKNARYLICSEKQKFGIRSEADFSSDFLEFRHCFEQAGLDWRKGEKERAVFSLRQAEKLYRGEFLEGWSEEWVLNARESLNEAYAWVMMTLASYMRMQKAWHEALVYARKAVQIDPTLEEAHSFSIECLLAIGKRDEAVKQFHVCREILRNELNVEPSENIRNLYLKAIQAQAV